MTIHTDPVKAYLVMTIIVIGGLAALLLLEILVEAVLTGESPQFLDVNRVYDWEEEQEPACYRRPPTRSHHREMRYGPQTDEIVDMLARIDRLSDSEKSHLSVGRQNSSGALDAAWLVRGEKARLVFQANVFDRTPAGAYHALVALTIRHRIGDVFTQAHYDALTLPWRTVVGKLHDNDEGIWYTE